MSSAAVRHRLSSQVELQLVDEADEATLLTPRGPVGFRNLARGQLRVLEALAGPGSTEDELLEARGDADGAEGTAWVHYTLDRLVQLGMVDRLIGDPPLAMVEVIGAQHRVSGRPLPDEPVALSRFAYMRRDGEHLVIESPRAMSRVVLLDRRGPAVLAEIAEAVEPSSVRWPEVVDPADGEALLTALFREGFLEPGSPAPTGEADDPASVERQALAEWSFHDLLFHSRSRQGRHSNPYGGTYRFEGVREPLPAVKEAPVGEVVDLPKPDMAGLRADDVPFAEVLESRTSLRVPGPESLGAAELGEFLFRAARVRGRRMSEHEEVSNRPYPGGGADYELEIYPFVHRVDGIGSGVYHYDPLGHRLTWIADLDGPADYFVRDTAAKAPPGEFPDVLFAVSARLGRLTYKYESIPYAIALKNLGVLYQTFYLVASAMGLAPCAVGGGNSELFASITGLSPYVEPQIGEFMLSSAHPDEVAANVIPQN